MSKSLICIVLISFFCAFVPEINGQLPSYMTACKRNDPNLNDCVLKVTKASVRKMAKGDPSRGFIKLDPLKIKEIKTSAFGNRETGINIKFTDVLIKGIRNFEAVKTQVDLKKQTVFLEGKVNLTLDSKYDLKGRLLIFPLLGNGNAHISLYNVKLRFYMTYGFVTKDGEQWGILKKLDLKHDIQGAKIKLDNLFNGDRVLGETTNRLLNENWSEVVSEIAPPMLTEVKSELTKISEKFLSQVKYDELFIPE